MAVWSVAEKSLTIANVYIYDGRTVLNSDCPFDSRDANNCSTNNFVETKVFWNVRCVNMLPKKTTSTVFTHLYLNCSLMFPFLMNPPVSCVNRVIKWVFHQSWFHLCEQTLLVNTASSSWLKERLPSNKLGFGTTAWFLSALKLLEEMHVYR